MIKKKKKQKEMSSAWLRLTTLDVIVPNNSRLYSTSNVIQHKLNDKEKESSPGVEAFKASIKAN